MSETTQSLKPSVTFREGRIFAVYERPGGIVVTGCPREDDDSHNCDEMGCGHEHVLYRSDVPADGAQRT